MNKLVGLAALPFMAGVAVAGQPVPLSEKQMDAITAGFAFAEMDVTNTDVVIVQVNQPAPAVGSTFLVGTSTVTAFLNVVNTWFGNSTVVAMQTVAFFGP